MNKSSVPYDGLVKNDSVYQAFLISSFIHGSMIELFWYSYEYIS